MTNRIFVTGIGTGIGKTLAAAVLAEALEADYWKPIQAGEEGGTDSGWVRERITNKTTMIHPEAKVLQLPASPHIAARQEGVTITVKDICRKVPATSHALVIEGAGGLLVPLNDREFVMDLIAGLDAQVVLVSRNYLGSINHSLLTARVCKEAGLNVAGWIFNDQYMDYEEEIVQWSGYPRLASIPHTDDPGKTFVQAQAARWKKHLQTFLC